MIFDILHEFAEKGWLIVVDGGLCRYGIRRDFVLVIYEILVLPEKQRQGVGSNILAKLKDAARRHHVTAIMAKCPERLAGANVWYAARGFKKVAVEKTKKGAAVNVWQLRVR